MSWKDRIVLDQAILVGKPVIKGTRIAVDFVIGLLAEGWTEQDILNNYPGLTKENIKCVLRYAASILKSEKVYPLQV
jgi:uncharacterized protein (DUF433 family)